MFRRRNVVLALFALVALFLAGCTGGTPGGGNGGVTGAQVSGYIYHDEINDDIWITASSSAPSVGSWIPLTGVTVRLYRDGQASPVRTGTTASNGRFAFTGLVRDSYQLIVGEPSRVIDFDLDSNQTLSLAYRDRTHYLIAGLKDDVNLLYNEVLELLPRDDHIRVHKVSDEQAVFDRYSVLNKIDTIGRSAGMYDDFVFIFSGISRGGSFDYLHLTSDPLGDTAGKYYLLDGELEEAIAEHFHRATLIIDGSQSETFADGKVGDRPNALKPFAFLDARYTILTATDTRDLARTVMHENKEIGLFTWALWRGLQRFRGFALADFAPQDRMITTIELLDFIFDELQDYYQRSDPRPDEGQPEPVHIGASNRPDGAVVVRY